MEIKQGLVFSSSSGGSFGFVPDWAKMVAITAPYTVPANGYISCGGVPNSARLVVDGVNCTNYGFQAQGSGAVLGNIFSLVGVAKGQSVSSTTPYCYFVPFAVASIKAFNSSASTALADGDSAPRNGFISVSSSAAVAAGLKINGNVVSSILPETTLFIPVNKGATISGGAATVNFIPFKS